MVLPSPISSLNGGSLHQHLQGNNSNNNSNSTGSVDNNNNTSTQQQRIMKMIQTTINIIRNTINKSHSIKYIRLQYTNNPNIQFTIATIAVFIFFGIHNYLQELIQYQFQLHHQSLNVMLGYYEVFGVFLFTHIERQVRINYSSSLYHPEQPNHLNSKKGDNTTSSPTASLPYISDTTISSTDTTTTSSSSLSSPSSSSSNTTSPNMDYSIRKAPLSVYPFLTFCLLSSSALSNLSLNYINFPTKVVFRSCKLIPTMIIATILHPNQTFTIVEYICATIICIGLICFGAAEFQTKPSFHPIGIVLVSCSVFADALLPNAQERVFHQYKAPRCEVTYYTNYFTLIIMTITTFMSGDFINCLYLMMEHPHTIGFYIFIYTIISYIAISCHMNVVCLYGGVAAVMVATGRKAMTLIISFLLFPKIYTIYYPVGTILVLSGITWASLSKVYNKKKKQYKTTTTTTTTTGVEAVPLIMKSHRSDVYNTDDNNNDEMENNVETIDINGGDSHRDHTSMNHKSIP